MGPLPYRYGPRDATDLCDVLCSLAEQGEAAPQDIWLAFTGFFTAVPHAVSEC
jgi:hypothetical protein